MHEPVEKNLKHKTDVLSWADIPWGPCDLAFRPPAAERLWMPIGRAYFHLLLPAAGGVGAAILLMKFAGPYLATQSSWLEAIVVAALVAMFVAAGFYRPLPRTVPRQKSAAVGAYTGVTVLIAYLLVRVCYTQVLFNAGMFAMFTLALPLCLLVADQMTGHMLHWMSANPNVDRNNMIRWQNAWLGRFMTDHVDALSATYPTLTIGDLKNYWQCHAFVIAAYVAAALAALAVELAGTTRPGAAFGIFSSLALSALAVAVDSNVPTARQRFTASLGHWFFYLKDTVKPPWIIQSPAGSQSVRACSAYGAVIVLAIAWTLLGMVESSTPEQSIGSLDRDSALTIGVAALTGMILAPLQLLLICFIVSTRVMSTCHQLLEVQESVCDHE